MRLLYLTPVLLLASRCGETPVDDTGPDTSPPTATAPVANLQAAIHDEMGSLVTAGWDQLEACAGYLQYRVEDESWLESPTGDLEVGAREQLLLGIPYDVEVRLRVVNDCGDGAVYSDSIVAQTDPLPEGLPHAAVITARDEGWDETLRYLLTSIDSREDAVNPDATWTIILDRKARTVWALATPTQRVTMAPHVATGSAGLLIDHNSFWAIFDGGEASQVLRVGLDGIEIELHDTPGLHHPLAELPDGTVVWGALAGTTETVELLPPGGEQATLWSCQLLHQQLGSMLPCSGNTLTYSQASGSFLFSFFSTDTVVEIDASSGETLRWFGHLDGSWAFDPEDSAFYWQHGAVYTDAGTLLTSTADGEPGQETLVREYELDHDAQTLRQLWSFGQGQGIYGDELGEAWRLPGGNTLHNTGTAQRLREITPDGEVVWDVSWTRGSFVGRSEPIEDLYALLP